MAAQTISEVANTHWSATRRTVRPEVVDNFFDPYEFMDYLRKDGTQIVDDGGKKIQINLEYAGGTAQSFSGADELGKGQNEIVQSAHHNRRYYACPVVIFDTDTWENSGKHKIFDEMEKRGNNAFKTIISRLDSDAFGAQSGKDMLGLQDIVADAGTGTVGGINSANETWWQNQKDTTSTTFLTQTVSNVFDGIDLWNDVMDSCEAEGARLGAVVSTRSIIRAYRIALSSQGYGEVNVADVKGMGGARTPTFYGARTLAANNCPANHSYFLTKGNLNLNVLKKANFKSTPFTSLQSNGQLGQIKYVVAGVQLTTPNRRGNGVATAITGA